MSASTNNNPASRTTPIRENICNLQFQSKIRIDQSSEGKIFGQWDEVSWPPLVTVATAVQQLAAEFVAIEGLNASIERRLPYARPENTNAELGDDVVIVSMDDLPDEARLRLHMIAQLFLNQIQVAADNDAAAFDFSGLLSTKDIDLVYRHVDSFRIASGGKRIAEEFICAIGDERITFARRFCAKPIPASGPSQARNVVARIEGAERKDNRGTCTLHIAGDNSRCEAAFVADAQLLAKIRGVLWDNEYHSVLIVESTTAGGKPAREVRDVGECVQIGAPLFAAPV